MHFIPFCNSQTHFTSHFLYCRWYHPYPLNLWFQISTLICNTKNRGETDFNCYLTNQPDTTSLLPNIKLQKRNDKTDKLCISTGTLKSKKKICENHFFPAVPKIQFPAVYNNYSRLTNVTCQCFTCLRCFVAEICFRKRLFDSDCINYRFVNFAQVITTNLTQRCCTSIYVKLLMLSSMQGKVTPPILLCMFV